ncbi:hypothetical protein [Mesorhizobium sp.]|nr:hypothetical protein [Mesorhizobium sp.]
MTLDFGDGFSRARQQRPIMERCHDQTETPPDMPRAYESVSRAG